MALYRRTSRVVSVDADIATSGPVGVVATARLQTRSKLQSLKLDDSTHIEIPRWVVKASVDISVSKAGFVLDLSTNTSSMVVLAWENLAIP